MMERGCQQSDSLADGQAEVLVLELALFTLDTPRHLADAFECVPCMPLALDASPPARRSLLAALGEAARH